MEILTNYFQGIDYKNGTLEIKLRLHWKAFIFIDYIIRSQWPNPKSSCFYEVHVFASYDFLHDTTCLMKKETKSVFRQAVFERFWVRLTQLTTTDTIFSQALGSFQNSNVWYTLPESVKNGIPVFVFNNSVSNEGSKFTLGPR